MCSVLKVSRSSYYRWFSGGPSNRFIENSLCTDLIKEEAKLAVFEYIEVGYNRKRLHSSLGYKTPKEMELEFYKIETVA